jgi:hypothetical protein
VKMELRIGNACRIENDSSKIKHHHIIMHMKYRSLGTFPSIP